MERKCTEMLSVFGLPQRHISVRVKCGGWTLKLTTGGSENMLLITQNIILKWSLLKGHNCLDVHFSIF